MIELIISDLDNTLLNDEKTISGYTIEILKKCRAKGIYTAFATARPERATRGFQELFQPNYIISNNGADISCNGKIIYNNSIPVEISNDLLSTLIKMNGVTYLTVETGECLYTNYQEEPWDNENWNLVYNDFSASLNIAPQKISIECKNLSLISELISKYPNLHLYSTTGDDWIHVMQTGSRKMNAVYYLSEMLGIDTKNIAAFGDDFNDIEMLKACGNGVAVENAIEPVKNAADFICLSNNNDGVANWIESNLYRF